MLGQETGTCVWSLWGSECLVLASSLPCGIEYNSEPRTLKCYSPLNSGVPQEVIVLALCDTGCVEPSMALYTTISLWLQFTEVCA